jgi:hypothetical protein
MRGKMLWFNAAKDVGSLQTVEGERVDVPGAAFSPGKKPAGRCAGIDVEFQTVDGVVTDLSFVEDASPRRARTRRRR